MVLRCRFRVACHARVVWSFSNAYSYRPPYPRTSTLPLRPCASAVKPTDFAMRIQILSDLHLEMNPCEVPVAGDVIVLAGDIHVGTDGIAWAEAQFSSTPVVYVAGNHEFYHQLFPDLLQDLRTEAAGSNVAVLENDVLIVNGVRFLGATLWTDFTLNGYVRQEINMAAAKHGLNDFRAIKKATGELLRPSDVAEVHRRSVEWLRAQLSEGHDGPTIVVTHHAPCIMSTHPQNRFNSLTSAFVSNLESLILDFQPAAWISGHTHYCSDYRIGETRLISNQRGYSDLDDTGGFDSGLLVDIPTSHTPAPNSQRTTHVAFAQPQDTKGAASV